MERKPIKTQYEIKLEEILKQDKGLSFVYELLSKDQQEEIKTNTNTYMQCYEYPLRKVKDLLYLQLHLPENIEVNDIVELSKKIQGKADQEKISFKDVITHAMQDVGVKYIREENYPDVAYLLDAIIMVGGNECLEKRNFFLRLIQGEKLSDRDLCQYVAADYGLVGVGKLISGNRDLEDEGWSALFKTISPLDFYKKDVESFYLNRLKDLNKYEVFEMYEE